MLSKAFFCRSKGFSYFARFFIIFAFMTFSSMLNWLSATATTPASAAPLAGVLASPGPGLTVNVAASRHAISPDIYGMNEYAADQALLTELSPGVVRWGGNLTTRYNWQVDASNHGSDYFYVGGDSITTANPNPPSGQANLFIENNIGNGSKSLLTIPIINYINKNGNLSCSFKVSKYPGIVQDDTEVIADGQICGNGLSGGNPITDTDILYNHVANMPTLQKGWVDYLVGRYGNAASGGVNFYEFDNEPSLWKETHRDVHPAVTTYEELRDRTYAYGALIKGADPTAQTLGPSDFGWTAYVESLDYNGRATHGGTWFANWYLQQMKAYEVANGVRLLDYFDEHYYPASNPGVCIALCLAGDAATQAQRLRSTRSLWDPTYIDESWINPDNGFDEIRLIPRFRDWVAQDYPGTKTAITEYNFGGLESINGALTQADVLGIFGREQLDLATIWSPPASNQPGAYAFRAFLNYNGVNSKFGDISVSASSGDQGQLAIYAAQRTTDQVLTMVIINKTGNPLTSSLALSGFDPAAQAKVYRYSAANLNAIVAQPNQAVTSSGFSATYPANSITIVELPTNNLPVYSAASIGPGNTFRLGATAPNTTRQASFTISNLGVPASNLQVSLNGGSVATALTGTNANQFGIANAADFPLNIAGGDSHAVDLSCTPTAIGAISASLTLTYPPGGGQPNVTVIYALSCSGGYMVTKAVDDGSDGTLSFGLSQTPAQIGSSISFELSSGGNSITFEAGSLLPLVVKTGVAIEGSCTAGPGIIIDGTGNTGNGLTLSGNNRITGVQVKGFGGTQLVAVAPATGNQLYCVNLQP